MSFLHGEHSPDKSGFIAQKMNAIPDHAEHKIVFTNSSRKRGTYFIGDKKMCYGHKDVGMPKRKAKKGHAREKGTPHLRKLGISQGFTGPLNTMKYKNTIRKITSQ